MRLILEISKPFDVTAWALKFQRPSVRLTLENFKALRCDCMGLEISKTFGETDPWNFKARWCDCMGLEISDLQWDWPLKFQSPSMWLHGPWNFKDLQYDRPLKFHRPLVSLQGIEILFCFLNCVPWNKVQGYGLQVTYYNVYTVGILATCHCL